ncbi:MAG: hypothetical protein JJU11_01485 [Candidatus Sumerlaeia bacterium]|nr:hypothetical protein [Candidatus Sumerlaeia bacterium]
MNSNTIIIVCHGSRSRGWTAALKDWFEEVSSLCDFRGIHADLLFTFLEINEPEFQATLRRFRDGDAPSRLGVFPFFLSRSGHAGEEIPEILEETLGDLPIQAFMTPPTAWVEALRRNVQRRLEEWDAPAGAPVIVSGYGSSGDDTQWVDLINGVRNHAGRYGGDRPWYWAPSGHFLDDYEAPLEAALHEVSATGARDVIILPLYLSVSSYQRELIPNVIARHQGRIKVHFKPDAILPCREIVEWGVDRVQECLAMMNSASRTIK